MGSVTCLPLGCEAHISVLNKATLCQINTCHHVGHFDICTGVGVVDVFYISHQVLVPICTK